MINNNRINITNTPQDRITAGEKSVIIDETGTTTFCGNIVPDQVVYSLGTSELPWKDVYISNGSLVIADVDPDMDAVTLSNTDKYIVVSRGGLKLTANDGLTEVFQLDNTGKIFIRNVDASDPYNIAIEMDGNIKFSDGSIQYTANIQSDWEQDDDTKIDYIKNKPIPITAVLPATYDSDLSIIGVDQDAFSHISSLNYAQFNTNPTGVPDAPGVLSWNPIEETLDLQINGVTLQLGQESVQQVKRYNNTGLEDGKVVYAKGSNGNNMLVDYAIASTDEGAHNVVGVMTESASGGSKALCTTFGLVHGINTSTLTEGQTVWLSSTSAGDMTSTTPISPNHSVRIGHCVRSHATEGVIFVDVEIGGDLNELHDVRVSSPSNGDLLAYESSSGLWKNKTISDLGFQSRVTGVSDTEIGYLDGVTSSIQSQLNTKQDVVGGVSSAEIGYLSNVTSDIQTQLNMKADLLSPTITMANLASASNSVDPLTISTANGHGGSGYAGLITLENSTSGATNTKKFIRMNSTGELQIVNNAYSSTIFAVTDGGDVSAAGKYNGATLGDTGWISVTSFNNGFSGNSVAYRKVNNVVYLRGNISGGTAGAGAFFLPSGFRPSTIEVVIPAQQYGTANTTYVSVGNDGNVVPNANAAWLSSMIFPVS